MAGRAAGEITLQAPVGGEEAGRTEETNSNTGLLTTPCLPTGQQAGTGSSSLNTCHHPLGFSGVKRGRKRVEKARIQGDKREEGKKQKDVNQTRVNLNRSNKWRVRQAADRPGQTSVQLVGNKRKGKQELGISFPSSHHCC